MNNIFMPIAFFVIRIISFFSISWLRYLGNVLGSLGFILVRSRRNVGLTNLRLCFPEMSETQKNNIIKAHFKALITSALEYSLVFYASKKRIEKMVTYKNLHYLDQHYGKRPIILLSPHFVGLDLAALRMTIDYVGFTLAVKQKNEYVNKQLILARSRFMKEVGGEVFTRDKGLRPIIRKLRADRQIFYYLPDQDFGEKDSVFVPFFAYLECATVNALPKLAALSNAVVVPMVVYQTDTGYEIEFFEELKNYPTDNLENDVTRMNQFIETVVLEHMEEYYWLHKRFKTQKGLHERGLLYK